MRRVVIVDTENYRDILELPSEVRRIGGAGRTDGRRCFVMRCAESAAATLPSCGEGGGVCNYQRYICS